MTKNIFRPNKFSYRLALMVLPLRVAVNLRICLQVNESAYECRTVCNRYRNSSSYCTRIVRCEIIGNPALIMVSRRVASVNPESATHHKHWTRLKHTPSDKEGPCILDRVRFRCQHHGISTNADSCPTDDKPASVFSFIGQVRRYNNDNKAKHVRRNSE